jgi:hypothetical protein
MDPRRRIALLLVAGAHLGIVAGGALEKLPRRGGWATRLLIEYAALSGADSFYTFFAPTVGPAIRLIFTVTDRSGGVCTDVLKGATNVEVDSRVDDLFSLFWYADDAFQGTLLRSWAGMMFTRHPGAERIVVRVEAYDLPSMAEYRRGRRSEWDVRHHATFSLEGGTAREARP